MVLEQVSGGCCIYSHTTFFTQMSQHGSKAPISVLPDTLPSETSAGILTFPLSLAFASVISNYQEHSLVKTQLFFAAVFTAVFPSRK